MSDPFTTASAEFVTNDDLEGRTLLVRPDEVGSRPSKTDPTKSYEYIVADAVVLDGEPTEKVDRVPMRLEDQQFTGGAIVGALKAKIGKRNPDGSRRLVLGTLTKVPSQRRGYNAAWVLADPGMEAIAAARAYLADDDSILAQDADNDDPFA